MQWKPLAKESLVLEIALLVVGSFIYPLLSGFLPTPGLPSFQSLLSSTGGLLSFVGLYVSIVISVWISKYIGPKMGMR